MLKQQLLAAKSERTGTRRAFRRLFDDLHQRRLVGQRRGRAIEPGAGRGPVEQSADRPPIADQCGCGAERAAVPLRRRKNLKRMALGEQARFGFGGPGSARNRADRGGQPNEVLALALERFGSAREPGVGALVRAGRVSELDQAGMAAMEAAKQMNRVGKVAAGMRPRSLDQRQQMGMARTAIVVDAREMRLGNADRLAVGPTARHSLPTTHRPDAPSLSRGP